MGFSNEAVGGTTLVRSAIQSPNYVPATSGWTINKDGSAEFNNLTVRGSLDITGASQGLFVYNGTPALGNLVLSVAAVAGTDPEGNAYPAGLKVFNGLLTISEPAALQFTSGDSHENTAAAIFAEVTGSGPAQSLQLSVNGPSVTTASHKDLVTATFNSAAEDGSSSANLEFLYLDPASTFHQYAFIDASGFNGLSCKSLVATQPGTGTPATPAVPETWHNFNPLSNSWSVPSGGFAKYRLTPENELQISAHIFSPTASTVNGVTIATFPTGYRPASTHGFPVTSSPQPSTYNASNSPQMTITSAGVLQSAGCGGNNAGAGSDVYIEVKIPLDL